MNIYKCLSGLSLVILLLGISTLTGCSENEESEREMNDSFFKINVQAESYGNKDLTRAAGKASADTIITPIDDDLYIETVLCNDTEQSGTTRASAAGVKEGTDITVLAYTKKSETSYEYKGKIEGKVSKGGNVMMAGGQLHLEPGDYTFICLANVEIAPETKPTYFYALKGQNSMSGRLETTIKKGDKDCKLSFNLKHNVGQIIVTIESESKKLFLNLTATLTARNYDGTVPTKQQFSLPGLAAQAHTEKKTLNDVLFNNITDIAHTSDENYYIAGYDYTGYAGITLEINSGTIAGKSLAGKRISFVNFDLQYNNINKVKVTLKEQQQSMDYIFTTTSPNPTVAATGGTATGTVTSTLNNASQPWEVESLSTTALTAGSLQTLDAVNSGIVTSYSPKSNAGTNNGSFSITMAPNTATTSRKIYARLKQKDSGKTVILTITQNGSTPVTPPESTDGSIEEGPWTEGGELNGTVESEWP